MVVILSQLSRCFLRGLAAEAERSQTITDSGRGEAADVAASPDDDNVARMLGRRRLRLRERRVEQRVEASRSTSGGGSAFGQSAVGREGAQAIIRESPMRSVAELGGPRGLQNRCGAVMPSRVGSTPMHSRQQPTVQDRCEDAYINA